MAEPSDTTPFTRRPLIKAFTASLAGTSLEWYDFAVYSAAAALVFPQLFFPESDALTGTLLAFATYAVGYVSRPLGGFVFGRLGDVIGRKQVLVSTLLLIGAATFLIGLLPTYASIGVVAPTCLVLLRFAQGVGVGGEWGGAVLLSSEFGDPRRRGFWSSAAQLGPPAGTLMSNGVLAVLVLSMSDEAFLAWGWRVAFLLSAALVGFGLWIRMNLEDTPVFAAIRERGEQPKAPIREVFATQRRALIAGILCRVGPDVSYALFAVFVLVYGTTVLGMDRGSVLAAILAGSAVQLVLIPLSGVISDRFNRRRVYAAAAVGTGLLPFVFFPAIAGGSTPVLVGGVVLGLALHSFMYGPQAAFITEQFPTRLRYTGSSLAYTLAGLIGGSIAPLLFTALIGAWDSWVPLAIYVAIAATVTLIGLLLGREPDPAEDEEYLRARALTSPGTVAG
jgi:MFS family permease